MYNRTKSDSQKLQIAKQDAAIREYKKLELKIHHWAYPATEYIAKVTMNTNWQ